MRWTLLIAILAIPCLLASAEDSEKPEVKLPYAIERAEKSLIRDADKALKAYNDAIEKAAAKYSNVLDSELKRAMRDGDLDLANKINDKKAMIECVKQAAADMKSITLEKKDVKSTKSTTKNKDPSKAIVGKWKVTYSNGAWRTVTISDTLKVIVTDGTFNVGEEYTLTYDKKTKSFSGICNGKLDTVTVTDDTASGSRADGKSITMTRITE